MTSHQIHARNCRIVKCALEKSGNYECNEPTPPKKGVDFIVTPKNGEPKFELQVRSRVYLLKKYCGKKMRFAFPEWKDGKCFVRLYCLDKMVQEFVEHWKGRGNGIPKSWDPRGNYHISPTPGWINPSVLRCFPCSPKK